MDIKEVGTCAVVVIGGVIYGVSSGGLKDALSTDIRYVTDVSNEERPEYMNGIVAEFSEAFEVYFVQTGTYDYVGNSKFSAFPASATFAEVVTAQEAVPRDEISKIKAAAEPGFCEQEEMTMFTEKGWRYNFTLRDENNRKILTVVCRPDSSAFDSNRAVG